MKILTSEQMQWVDRLTTDRYGIPGLLLMETAGSSAAKIIEERFPQARRFKIFCAKGNNGGDGAVIARHLWLRHRHVALYLIGKVEDTRGDARVNFEIIQKLAKTESTIAFHQVSSFDELQPVISEPCDVYIDALFGTGAARPLEGIYRQLVEALNTSTIPIVSVDIPSGLAANSSEIIGTTVRATLTIAMSAPKIANLLPPASYLNGELQIVPIGSPDPLIAESGAFLNLVDRQHIADFLTKSRRRAGSYKNEVGHVMVIAGSRGKSGAAGLAALAALRAGTGLVTVFTPADSAQYLAQAGLEIMTEPVAQTDEGTISINALKQLLEASNKKSVIACGPGLGTHAETRELVKELLLQAKLPLVLDADALNCITLWPEALKGSSLRPVIITPHPGEMTRLLAACAGKTLAPDLHTRTEQIRELAISRGIFVALKGEKTLLADPNGQVYVNSTGNAGLATAGTGDVLTGIVAGMIAQYPKDVLEATLSAIYLHGLAGDIAARQLGQRSMIASDVLAALPAAILEVGGELETRNYNRPA
ncbi:MAG: NAD(P)H-hydrate dehydratase [Acidobacteriota bacterium]|nr:NAD(P)H-hydrate dehydratase [Blastocatellia bacterium]MDW8411192.1 NAD(P)H-hydrate dehydratase [Acidobacteriota bacterium]